MTAFPLMLRKTHEARKRRVWLAALAAQQWNEAMQRRAFMPIKGTQIDLLELTTAGTDDIQKLAQLAQNRTLHVDKSIS